MNDTSSRIRINPIQESLQSWKWQVAIFAIIHIFIFTVFFKTGWIYGNFIQGDFGLPYFYSSRIMSGYMPYRDFNLEYPPIALAFMLLPRLLSSNPETYAQLFSVEMLVFDLIGLFLIAAISDRLGKPLWKTLTIYTLAMLAVGPIITVRYDIIPAVMLLGALYAFMRKNYTISWVLLAIGLFTKLFPVIVAPLFPIYHLHHRQYRQMTKGITAFILTCAIISIPLLIISPGGFLNSFTYQTGRSLQCETTYASFLLLAKSFGLVSFEIAISSGSVNIISHIADTLAKLSLLIMLIASLIVFWKYYRDSKSRILHKQYPNIQTEYCEIDDMISYWLLVLLVFVLTNKVFSPQYLIWFLPLIPLITSRWGNLPWLIFIMVGFMTYFVYPKDYGGLEHGEWLAIGMLVLRNIALIGLAVLVARGRTYIIYREESRSG